MGQFRYLGTNLTYQNFIPEEIKIGLKSENPCLHSVQNLFISSFLFKNIKIEMYRTIILPVVLCGCMGQGRGVYRVLVGKPEGKRPLGRPRRRWEDNIKIDLQEVGGGCEDWKELPQGRDRWWELVSTVINLRVPKMREIS